MSKSVIAGLKLMLSTGEYADVHFLVGDGEEKELLSAHKLILTLASDVFEAMFRFDAKKEQGENAANCHVMEVPDVEAEAFKVMLSFIYSGEFSELNGDNAMAVLCAAKKYNIPDLANASLQVPLSELHNVFFAYAYACIFELEDFSGQCLRYICQNATKLFESDDFLQIDQKMLSGLLQSDLLLFSDEFQLWKASIRWADAKCRQNGIECSQENRRAVLGPALFKIRFPNIYEEDFSKCVVPFGVLTMEEQYGIYQYNSHPYLYLRVPDELLYALKFPSHGRIFDWNTAKGNRRGTLALEIEKLSEFAGEKVGSRRLSDAVHIKGVSWQIEAQIRQKRNSEGSTDYLGFYLWYDASNEEEGYWRNEYSATFRIVWQKSKAANSTGTLSDRVINNTKNWLGFDFFITFAELMNASKGFYNKEEDKVTLAIDVTVK
ncbi:hypothetical protein niasHT_020191 [Heterodera trifolii]|uniref:BTB domain-containing protein n=1 Tax=Heterodera trifolii TaxID=157864 RepID=A0ABD2K4A2_9BILA